MTHQTTPTTLLDHPTDGSSRNCLAVALGAARAGVDDIVFLSGPETAPIPGHVVRRDGRLGLLQEQAEAASCSVDDYAASQGRQVMAVVPVEHVRDILDLPPAARAAALARQGGALEAIAKQPFGIAGPAPVVPPKPPAPPTGSSVEDKHVKAWLDAVGNNVSDKDKAALAQTGNDASTLEAWFNAHKRGDPKLNDMPQNVADAEKRLLADDAVAKQLVTGGQVTRDTVGAFLKSVDGAADQAKTSWGDFKKNNGSADPAATQQAVDASILQANLPVLDAAGSANAKVDGKINVDDLKAVASGASNAGLPAPLAHAAAFYADPSVFSNLTNAGLDPAKPSDGYANNDSFKALLAKGTSKTPADTISGLRAAALQDVSAGGDPSKVNADYFKDPSKSTASAADKLAALVKLEKTIGVYNAGQGAYQQNSPAALNSPDAYHQNYGDGPTPGQQRDDYIKQVKDRIQTLGKDTDVQKLLTDKLPSALQGLVSSDPAVKASLQPQFEAASNADALKGAFAQKDDKGNPLSTVDALSRFVSNANNYAQALGITPDYSKALAGAPQDIKDKVKQGYDDITSGKKIDDLTKSGTPQDKAVIQAVADKTAFDSVLDQKTVQDGNNKFGDVAAKLGRNQLTDGKTADDLLKGLGVSGENDPKLQKLINDNLNQLAPAGKDQATSSDVLRIVRGITDSMRAHMKFDDAVGKIQKEMGKTGSPVYTGAASDAYKSGAIHAASALLLAGGLAARVSGGQSTPTQTAQDSISAAGLLAEGGGKAYAGIFDGLKATVADDKKALEAAKALPFNQEAVKYAQAKYDQSKALFDANTNIGKTVENLGKTVGGVAGNALGFITGIIGATQAGNAGNIGGAAAQGIFAGLNGISTVANTAEVASYVIPRVASVVGTELASNAPELAALIGGVAGTIGAVAGGAAAIGGLIYAIVASIQADNKKSADQASWYKRLQDGFGPAGLPLPDLGTLISAPNGYVPDGPVPVTY